MIFTDWMATTCPILLKLGAMFWETTGVTTTEGGGAAAARRMPAAPSQKIFPKDIVIGPAYSGTRQNSLDLIRQLYCLCYVTLL
jgi:hypothetical protein